MGELLAVDPRYIPDTEEEYWKRFNDMIENKLIMGEVLEDLLDPKHFSRHPKPPELQYLPNFLWKAIAAPAGWLIHKVTVATLPENFRRRFQIRYSKADQWFFKGFAALVRLTYPLVPLRMRYIPLSRRAIDDANQHPEAYLYNYSKNEPITA